jgi:hypothetical protein
MSMTGSTRRALVTMTMVGALAAPIAAGVGPAGANPVPSAGLAPTSSIDGGQAVFALSPTLSSALLAAEVSVTASGPATVTTESPSGAPDIRVSFPIRSGDVSSTGRVRMNLAGAAIYASPTAGTFVTSDPRIIVDPDGNGQVTVRFNQQGRLQGATLDFSGATVVSVGAHVRIANVKFVLNAASAAAYNELAGTNTFAPGQVGATVKIGIHLA